MTSTVSVFYDLSLKPKRNKLKKDPAPRRAPEQAADDCRLRLLAFGAPWIGDDRNIPTKDMNPLSVESTSGGAPRGNVEEHGSSP